MTASSSLSPRCASPSFHDRPVDERCEDEAYRAARAATAWQLFVDGMLGEGVSRSDGARFTTTFRVAKADGPGRGLTWRELGAVQQVLLGVRHKVVALNLRISTAHVSVLLGKVSNRLGLLARAWPLPMVVFAQQHSRASGRCLVDVGFSEAEGVRFVSISIPRPRPQGALLTSSEQSVACLFVAGVSRFELASVRQASCRTVACQLASVFDKLKVGNRYEMALSFAERGWFEESTGSGEARLWPAPSAAFARPPRHVTPTKAAAAIAGSRSYEAMPFAPTSRAS